jgi:hypothetical protein
MKKWIAISIVLNVALLGVALHGVLADRTASAAPGGGRPSGNGDVNGDGQIDIADAIYLLLYLFVEGKAPVPIDVSGSSLPATGQTTCYDDFGIPMDCAGADFPGQDGFHRAGFPMEGRFIDMGDGTVADTCTGLLWQQETAHGKYTWQEALQYCDGLGLAGFDDWRLPNVRELQSIVDYGHFDPAIDPVFGAVSDWYWSSTTYDPIDPNHAWYVRFWDGYVIVDKNFAKDTRYYVRAVRAIQAGE